jgi:hypothetical protein
VAVPVAGRDLKRGGVGVRRGAAACLEYAPGRGGQPTRPRSTRCVTDSEVSTRRQQGGLKGQRHDRSNHPGTRAVGPRPRRVGLARTPRMRTLSPAGHAWSVRKKRLVGPYYPSEVEEEIRDYSARLVTTLEDSGVYAGTAVEWHPHARRFILYGVGEVPTASVAAVIDAAPEVVEVVWRPARYTSAELVEECGRIMERFPQVSVGGPGNDGSGLEFTTEDLALVNAGDVQAVLGTRYAVTIEYGPPPGPGW